MVTRTILNNFNSKTEQRLYEDILNEFTQTFGIDVQYLPRDSADPNGFDLLFGDDPVKKFANNYTIECYVQSVDNFEGAEIYSKFGLQVKKQAKFLMPNRAWKRETEGVYLRPREGDLLWLKNFGALFEIKYVNEDYFYFPFGKGASDPSAQETNFYGFSITAEKFRYNDETIQTSIPEISSVVNSVIATYVFNMNTGGTGSYSIGDVVYQTSNNNVAGQQTANAIVTNWNEPTATLELNTINGVFIANNYIFDVSANVSWTLNNYSMLTNTNNPYMDNAGINEEANTVLNFSTDNPFGQP